MNKLVGMERPFIYECLNHLLKIFGPTRLIYGSDWPYSNVAFDYQEQIRWIEEAFESLTSEEINAIFGTTAERVYLS